jgi:hypothetical protein
MKFALVVQLSLLLSISFSTFSQNTYSKVYNIINGNEYGVEINYKNNKQLIIAIGICDPDEIYFNKCTYFLSSENTFIKFDTFKNQRFHPGPGFATSVQNDTIFVFGTDFRYFPYNFVVYKTNISGDSLGMIQCDKLDTQVFGTSIVVMDSFIYLLGQFDTPLGKRNLLVQKLDKNGKLVKEVRFEEENKKIENLGTSMIQTTDGNLALVSYYFENENRHVGVRKLDRNLNTLWIKYFEPSLHASRNKNPWPCMVATDDDGMVVSNEINILEDILEGKYKDTGLGEFPVILSKLYKDGSLNWTDTLFTYDYPGRFLDSPTRIITQLYHCNNGDILCIGEWYCFYCAPRHKAWLARYSPDGRLLWEHYYTDPKYNINGFGSYFMDAKEAENGDIICTGSIDDDYNTYGNDKQYTWLLRLDSLGCFTPDCFTEDTLTEVIITSNEEISINISGKIAIYPNPAQDIINISVPEDFVAERAEIYDVFGQKVMKLAQDFEDIDISQMQTGIFFVVVRDRADRILKGKFVKI